MLSGFVLFFIWEKNTFSSLLTAISSSITDQGGWYDYAIKP